jgi:hypothetical protein
MDDSDALYLERRSRGEVLEGVAPMVKDIFEAWGAAVERHGVPSGFEDVNLKILSAGLIVVAVLPDAPDA